MTSSEAVKLLVIAEAEIASTHLLMQVLHAAKPLGISADLVVASQWKDRVLPSDVTPLFARCGDPSVLPYARSLVRSGRSYLYYLDDDFWGLDPASPLGAYYAQPKVRASLNYFLQHAAMVLTNTDQLSIHLRQHTSRPIVQVPTYFKFDLIENVNPERTQEIRIGFAGSIGRDADLELIKPSIGPVLASHPDTVFEFVGTMPRGVQTNDRIRFFPTMSDYDSFIRFQASRNWSIGLAPLLPTTSNSSKTDNKFREYAACSIAGVYSNFGPYPARVTHGVDGLLVSDGGWTDALLTLIAEPDRLMRMRQKARATALVRYELDHAAGAWTRAIQPYIVRSESIPTVDLVRVRRQGWLQRMQSLLLRLQLAFKEGGTRLVLVKARRWLGVRSGRQGDAS